MTRRIAITVLLFCSLWGKVSGQESYPERARKYVQQYAQYAIADQRSTGVPASITLGQGILETEAGISELVTEANNHFGIKCKNGWQGATFLHDDDAKGECFKKYNNALESYHDHSAHLLINQRYKILFSYSPTDYARWAHGLKKCGYATNPKYAYQLIKIIEDYHLQEYTYAALDSNYKLDMPGGDTAAQTMLAATQVKKPDTVVKTTAASVPTVAATTVMATTTVAATSDSTIAIASGSSDTTATVDTAAGAEGAIMMVNGLKAIRVHKGEALLPYAVKHKVRYGHLLELNDMPEDPVMSDMYIYLEKKHAAGLKSNHSVREGETLHMVAQEEGMQLKKLAAFNLLRPAEVPVTGTVLNLQGQALTKPAVKEVMLAYSADVQEEQSAEPEPQAVAANSSEQEIGFGMGFQNPAQAQAAPAPEQKEPDAMPAPAVRQDEPVKTEQQKPGEAKRAGGNTKHVVKKGETAFSIAKRYNVTVDDIARWNSVKPQSLKVGQTLLIKQ
ncbi:MAG: LysM peptidoglycan-binding domain-containing protein [Taibaiella sp.]|nr:LysM peptidoglycan-binding domain-containing protein [Taibaiella sp.]